MSQKVSWNKEAKGFRLPTEAEWEYCARAGVYTPYSGGSDIDRVGWYWGNSNRTTHAVGQKSPNAFGLYDISGNICEWVWDTAVLDGYNALTENLYRDRNVKNPICEHLSSIRMYRGGAWNFKATGLRVSYRSKTESVAAKKFLGFRFIKNG